MIITRTPLRISLGGGGTDLPSYYERHGGFVISGAIDKYIFVAINRTFVDDYLLKYSVVERVHSVADIAHPIIREVLTEHQVGPGIEIVSVADIPAGTGLGSSGAFTVGLLRAVLALTRDHALPGEIAEAAARVEMDKLGRPTGKQDQYIAAFGGLTCFDFETDGRVHASPLMISNETLNDLEEHLVMFFTGYSREADLVLSEQKRRSQDGESEMIDNLHFIKHLGLSSKDALERGDVEEFATLMDEHWQHKRRRSHLMSNESIDRWYQVAMDSGALGGKLVGAGAGGFLLFYAKDQDGVREALKAEGLHEVRFGFDHDGSTVLVRS